MLAAGNHPLLRSPADPTPITRDELEQTPVHWTDETLSIAEAIRKGESRVVVPREPHEYAEMYAQRLADLGQRFPGVTFAPADTEAFAAGRATHVEQVADLSQQASGAARVARMQVPTAKTGQTLYEALDAYAQRALRKNTEHARAEAARAGRLKHATADMDLAQFGYAALERIREYWTARPQARLANGKRSGRSISVHTVDGQVKTARRFATWLDETDQYPWQMPRHGLRMLKINLNKLQTPEEVSRRRHGAQTFAVDHLTTIWRYASDTERLLVLLGLNAAMAQAEATGLRWDELEQNTIKRVRHKSGVYAEFALWPETVKALAWWRSIRHVKADQVMVTDQNRPYTRQRIANMWARLADRITRKTGERPAWWLPFKHLRKTGAQLVRDASDGEIAGVYLSHGQPVQSDDLSDIYSRRPFGKVAEALGKVHAHLEPVFASAPDAFTSTNVGGRGPERKSTGAA